MKKLEISQMENLQGGFEMTCRKAGYLTNVGIVSMVFGAGGFGGALVGIFGAWYVEHCMK